MKWKLYIVIFLIISSGIVFYFAAEPTLAREVVFVSRVIDGDTLEVLSGDKIRLLGINTPEKGMANWEEARLFLEGLVLNRSVEFEFKEIDKYGRWLGYVFIGSENINKLILSNGLAHLYVYEEDKWYDELASAEEFARMNELGIWKKSLLSGCIKLVELKYEEDGGRCIDGERLILSNSCGFSVDVLIKDEATHIYHETLDVGLFEKNFSCVWNDDGDSVFVWEEGDDGLLIFYRY